MTVITFNDANEAFRFDAETVRLFWKINRSKVKAGTEVGSVHHSGYRHTFLNKKTHQVHRIIWMMEYGEYPDGYIDHIDGNPLNNRIENLRVVSQKINTRNSSKKSSNTSGHIGVSWCKQVSKWRAQISTDAGRKHLGDFENIEDAVLARKNADSLNGYHENHGRQSKNTRGETA